MAKNYGVLSNYGVVLSLTSILLFEENSSKMGVLLQPSSAGTCMNKHPSAQHGPPEGTYIRVFSELIWTR